MSLLKSRAAKNPNVRVIAWALAAANAKLRPSSAALVMLAEAQLAAGDKAGAKAAIDKALAMPAKNAELFWVASKVYGPSSKRGTTLRAQALAINPKQASM